MEPSISLSVGRMVESTLREKIVGRLTENQLSLTIRGVGSFGSKVVYAEVAEGAEELKAINKALLEAFTEAGFVCDTRFTPHATIMKGRGAGEGIPREAYDQFTDKTFGHQPVTEIKLLSMTKKKTPDGFFHCERSFQL